MMIRKPAEELNARAGGTESKEPDDEKEENGGEEGKSGSVDVGMGGFRTVLELQKVGSDKFSLEFSEDISPLLAFSTALTQFLK